MLPEALLKYAFTDLRASPVIITIMVGTSAIHECVSVCVFLHSR